MANKVPVQGVVEQVSSSGFKLGGKWFNLANKANSKDIPAAGQTVSFDAYGQEQNIFYRYTVEDNGNGSAASVPVQAANGSNGNGSDPRLPVGLPAGGAAGLRGVALQAAATLMQGSDGTVADVASNTLAVAKAFEGYLTGQDEELPE